MTKETDDIRLIKKYPNRRLYDTQDSCYITLEDTRKMVQDNTSFKVVDQKTGDDITRSILLQIIMEQESSGEHLFNSDILSEFIRNYGDTSRDNFTSFLQASMQMFSEQQSVLVSKMDEAFQGSPMDFWVKMSQQNLEQFQQLQQNFFNSEKSNSTK